MLAELHPQQARRLEALASYGVLDTAPEAEFDDIVQLAARLCDMPVALISLVTDTRQWFKAETGLCATETGLDKSVCSHAILELGLTEIPDMLKDARTADNPLTQESPPMRFYAGAPLRTADGLPIGTLCVLDHRPRSLTPLQRDTLVMLARQVMKQLDLHKALADMATLQREMDHRVKNSLQTVASFTRLIGREVTDARAIQVLDAVQMRINAVSALHEELQGAAGDGRIDAGAYLARICELVQDSGQTDIAVTHDLTPCALPSGRAAALGMIVSEFAANSFKHGFPDGRTGEISVSLRVGRDGRARLECRDNGIGDDGESGGTGLGRSLIAAAASQLDGTLAHTMEPDGARLTVDFPARADQLPR